jgi:hypothetical protein
MPEPSEFAQADAYDAQGNPVAPELVGDAVAKGQAFFKKDAKVYATNADGELVTVSAQDATKPGYTVLSGDQLRKEYNRKKYGKDAGDVALATAAGAARGLTLGASDAVLSGVGGDDTRRALQGLREANPIASGVGEVAGAVAPVLLTGGASAGASAGAAGARSGASLGARALSGAATAVKTAGIAPRAAAAVGSIVERGVARGLAAAGYEGKTVLGRAAAGALKTASAGAAEGAIYGGAQAANDAVLSGDAITAEKIVAGMGHGALFGAGVGGVLGSAGPLITGAATKLRPGKETLENLAKEQALQSVLRGTDFRRIAGKAVGEAAEKRIAATGDDLIGYTFKSGPLKGERVMLPGRNTEELVERITYAKEEIGAAIGGAKKELSERMAQAGDSPDVGEFLRRVDENVISPLMKSKSPGAMSKARAVNKELAILRDEHQARMMAKAAAEAGETMPVRLPDGRVELRPREVPPAPTYEDLDAFRSRLAEKVYPQAGSAGGMPAAPSKAVKYFEQAERTLADYLKEKAAGALRSAGDDPNAFNELNRQYNSFRKLEQLAGKNANQTLGNRSVSPSDHALGLASFMGAMATGNVGALGAMAYGGAATMANKLLRERGNSFVAYYAQKAAQMDDRIDQVAQALAGRVNVKPPALAASLQGEGLRDSYQKTSERIRELARPAVAAQHVSGLVPEVASQYPRVGSAVSAKLLGIYQQLSAKLPASHVDTGETLTPLAIQRRVTPQAMRSFMASVRGALEPESVINDLAHGVVDRDAVEALKMAHPETFMQLRNKVADYVEQNEEQLPFKRRIMLSLTFDFAGDSSLEPQRMAALQQAAQEVSAGVGEPQQGAPPPKRGNPGVSRLGSSFATPADSAFGGSKS